MWWYLRKKYIFLENLPIYFKSPLLLSISIFTANWYSDKVLLSFPKIPLTFLKLHAVNIFLMICCFFFFPFHLPHTSIQRTGQLESYPDILNTSTSWECFYGYCELMNILPYCFNFPFHQKHFILLNFVKRKKETTAKKCSTIFFQKFDF